MIPLAPRCHSSPISAAWRRSDRGEKDEAQRLRRAGSSCPPQSVQCGLRAAGVVDRRREELRLALQSLVLRTAAGDRSRELLERAVVLDRSLRVLVLVHIHCYTSFPSVLAQS